MRGRYQTITLVVPLAVERRILSIILSREKYMHPITARREEDIIQNCKKNSRNEDNNYITAGASREEDINLYTE